MLCRLAARRCGDLRLRGAVHCRAISSIADRSLTNLADAGLGARVLFATDEWFATADNLLQPHAPHFDSETFCTQGKVMDGWESRRRRLPGHDWALLRLGLAGSVKRVEIDTAHFTGNQTPAVRVLAACIDAEEGEASRGGGELPETAWLGPPRADLGQRGSCASADEIARARAAVEAKAEWCELVPESRLRAGYVPPELASRRVTHLLVDALPDGGIARMRAWGTVARDFATELDAAAVGSLDLLSALNGARALGCSNRHYGEPSNLLRPGRGERMDHGWETARNPNRPAVLRQDPSSGLVDMPGASEWCVFRLAAVAGGIERLEIDTAHFRGNYPESCLVEVCDAPHAEVQDLLEGAGEWRPLLDELDSSAGRATHARVSIFPDGGIMRVRAFGRAVAPMPE
ncbi:hypothetical protein EMIHUDRAFT_459309 [Emiliania huxleyi CCMP1516]|uniref:Allantoicase domain-containing protein n=2 Tax=Emiliania huxleyi TaxID=2903 RepID=A0A0D3IAT5_EMIH1|nr:hypothetical protein EMIHUDRAFT_453099 [Emiliania huxleyi CCMP1516]XP_005767951.1 hypothetical protein EMIHUDRAFT_459309 [Emiliania huxleyi CCMP1516]EOD08370.1 hypothetical protein EMIHUDRAFT_453099 [Emiliania huxleyi CCMP1516]EOD15522.1 hypothetical protein EMIHUDRAFT_459309 [Emiliania huxleyi CCMP1516]|eukprot:XP_005760799.1 hypothetical protein EMIHUDRAFT_453099 [Emiliania huxleyi CCMP1516]